MPRRARSMGATRLPLHHTKYGGKRFSEVSAQLSCQPLNHMDRGADCTAYSTMHCKTANVAEPVGCIPDCWAADVCIRYGQLFVFRAPTRTRNLNLGMDRTVAAQFSCNPPLWAPCPTISSPPAAVRDSSKRRCSATGTLPDRRTAAKKAHRSGRRGFGGGRCGGNPPAQGRAEGPTAQKQERVKRREEHLGSLQSKSQDGMWLRRCGFSSAAKKGDTKRHNNLGCTQPVLLSL